MNGEIKARFTGLEQAWELSPTISPLDLHYLCLKCYGVRDAQAHFGRPSWNIFDEHSLYHVTFRIHDPESPYEIQDDTILLRGEPLPFEVRFVERVPAVNGRYHYVRHADVLTPTLDDRRILNFNFKRQCFKCSFCQFPLYRHQPDISPEQGFQLLFMRGDLKSLEHYDEIAVVTGCFDSSEECVAHLSSVARLSATHGFRGQLMYLGSQICCRNNVTDLLQAVDEAGLSGLRIVFAIECFGDRSRFMTGLKGRTRIGEIAEQLCELREAGLQSLEYSYIPGLDGLEIFLQGARFISELALPHVSIFSPWRHNQRWLLTSPDYRQLGPKYLFQMRQELEVLHGGPIYGDNLGNLWPFPRSRVDKRWFEHEFVGPSVGRRWWKGETDARALDVQVL